MELKGAEGYLDHLKSAELLTCADVAQDKRLGGLKRIFIKGKIRSFVHVPVNHSEHLLGVLRFDSPQPAKWSGHEIINMREASQYLTVAMKNAFIESSRKKVAEQMAASLKEKETLLKEVHHRVKNNMTVIHSLLNLQAETLLDERAKEIFGVTRERINSMALIHDQLYNSDNLAGIDFGEYVQALVGGLVHSYGVDGSRVEIVLAVEGIEFSLDTAMPCGLIVNELVSNCFKYAFPDFREGRIVVSLDRREEDGFYILKVRDNGIGFPGEIDFRNTESMGMQLVNIFTEQLEGEVELSRRGGTEFKIIFPATCEEGTKEYAEKDYSCSRG
jgi:two-component sensor histidine kinase